MRSMLHALFFFTFSPWGCWSKIQSIYWCRAFCFTEKNCNLFLFIGVAVVVASWNGVSAKASFAHLLLWSNWLDNNEISFVWWSLNSAGDCRHCRSISTAFEFLYCLHFSSEIKCMHAGTFYRDSNLDSTLSFLNCFYLSIDHTQCWYFCINYARTTPASHLLWSATTNWSWSKYQSSNCMTHGSHNITSITLASLWKVMVCCDGNLSSNDYI